MCLINLLESPRQHRPHTQTRILHIHLPNTAAHHRVFSQLHGHHVLDGAENLLHVLKVRLAHKVHGEHVGLDGALVDVVQLVVGEQVLAELFAGEAELVGERPEAGLLAVVEAVLAGGVLVEVEGGVVVGVVGVVRAEELGLVVLHGDEVGAVVEVEVVVGVEEVVDGVGGADAVEVGGVEGPGGVEAVGDVGVFLLVALVVGVGGGGEADVAALLEGGEVEGLVVLHAL